MKTLILKPRSPELTVRFPGNPQRVLKPEGEEVPNNPYWLRRLAGGDVKKITKISKTTTQTGDKNDNI